MRSFAIALGLLLIAICRPSFAQDAAQAPAEEVVRVAEGAPLTVTCALRVEERAHWRRDGAPPPVDMRADEAPAPAPGGGLAARLHAAAARAHHQGRYTCSRRTSERGVRVLLTAPAAATAEEGDKSADSGVVWDQVVYTLGRPLQLNCSSGDADRAGVTFSWQVNGTALDKSALSGRYKLVGKDGDALRIDKTIEDDYGNYTCLMNNLVAQTWTVGADPLLFLPKNSNVVEGQKLKLTCRVVGKPYPAVTWWYALDEAAALEPARDVNVTDSAAGVPGGEVVLEAARRDQAGRYSCRALNATATTTVRVKDMYAALWPFLGICLEVFVLCAIILVYEKRRTKPEHEDSDTDNHEQKKG